MEKALEVMGGAEEGEGRIRGGKVEEREEMADRVAKAEEGRRDGEINMVEEKVNEEGVENEEEFVAVDEVEEVEMMEKVCAV